jgi:Holliday junction resolvasome RuvABC endonuclease subunit
MRSFFVLGIDPGLASCGVAVLEVFYREERLHSMEVLRTAASHKKLKILVCDDLSRRVSEMTDMLQARIDTYGPRLVCTEAFSAPRNASSAAKAGMGWAIAAALARIHGIPLLQATPQQIKKAHTGKVTSTKAEVQAALEKRYPRVVKRFVSKIGKEQQEHPVDALAAAVTCFDSDAMRGARAGLDP